MQLIDAYLSAAVVGELPGKDLLGVRLGGADTWIQGGSRTALVIQIIIDFLETI